MKRVSLGKRYEWERVVVWMPKVWRTRRDSSIQAQHFPSQNHAGASIMDGSKRGGKTRCNEDF